MANPTNTTPRGVAGQTLTTLYAKIRTLWTNPLDPVGQPSGRLPTLCAHGNWPRGWSRIDHSCPAKLGQIWKFVLRASCRGRKAIIVADWQARRVGVGESRFTPSVKRPAFVAVSPWRSSPLKIGCAWAVYVQRPTLQTGAPG